MCEGGGGEGGYNVKGFQMMGALLDLQVEHYNLEIYKIFLAKLYNPDFVNLPRMQAHKNPF